MSARPRIPAGNRTPVGLVAALVAVVAAGIVAGRAELLSLAGFALISLGVWWIYEPAGVITGGLSLLVVAKAAEGDR